MAYSKQQGEHAFKRIGKDLKSGKLPAAVLLHGEEEFLINFYADAIIKKYVNPACESMDLVTLDRDTVTMDSITEALETLPLMSERKVVFLPDITDRKGKFPTGIKPDELALYLAQLPEGTMMLMTMAKCDDDRDALSVTRSGFYKTLSGLGATYDFSPLDHDQLRGFIEKRFIAAGKTYRPGIVGLIARESGYGNKNVDYGLYTLNNDLQKIIAHSGRNPEITMEDVETALTRSPENDTFAMLDAIGRNRKDEAFRLLNNLLYDGVADMQLLAMITRQLELILQVREMREQNIRLEDIQKALKKDKIHEYRTKKAYEIGNRFNSRDLRRILGSAYEVDRNIKTGLMPGQLALEYFIAGI